MTRGFAVGRIALALAFVGAFLAAATAMADADGPSRPNLRVASFSSGSCGPFSDSLPPLVTRTDIRTDEEAGDVTVCVGNGGHGSGALRLRVAERVEVDSSCSGDEADADATCGSNAAGELGPALVQQIGAERCSRVGPPVSLAHEHRLPELEAPVLLAHRLTPGHVVCVRLRLRYAPADAAARVASQSDATSWRYVFDLMSGE